MISWKYKYFNSATYDREMPGSFGFVLLESTWGAKPTDKHQTQRTHAIPQQYVREVFFACQCIHEYVHVQGIHTSLKFSHISLWSVMCMTVSVSCTYTCMQMKQDFLWMLSFALFNHEKGCFVASKSWFMLHLSQVHLHPQPFTMLPDPSTSYTECGRKWGNTGTAHPLSEILSHIQWIPYQAVNWPLWTTFCFPAGSESNTTS